jgi:hypothetical protein
MYPQKDFLTDPYFNCYLLTTFISIGLIICGLIYMEKADRKYWHCLFLELDNIETVLQNLLLNKQEMKYLLKTIKIFRLIKKNLE